MKGYKLDILINDEPKCQNKKRGSRCLMNDVDFYLEDSCEGKNCDC